MEINIYSIIQWLGICYLTIILISGLILLYLSVSGKYLIKFIFRPGSFWIGIHRSSDCNRLCINLLPFFTFRCDKLQSININNISLYQNLHTQKPDSKLKNTIDTYLSITILMLIFTFTVDFIINKLHNKDFIIFDKIMYIFFILSITLIICKMSIVFINYIANKE